MQHAHISSFDQSNYMARFRFCIVVNTKGPYRGFVSHLSAWQPYYFAILRGMSNNMAAVPSERVPLIKSFCDSPLKQRRWQRECLLQLYFRVSEIIPPLFQVVLLSKCQLTILELNWKEWLGDGKNKPKIWLKIWRQALSRSFHFVERTRTAANVQKRKACNTLLFSIVKYAN